MILTEQWQMKPHSYMYFPIRQPYWTPSWIFAVLGQSSLAHQFFSIIDLKWSTCAKYDTFFQSVTIFLLTDCTNFGFVQENDKRWQDIVAIFESSEPFNLPWHLVFSWLTIQYQWILDKIKLNTTYDLPMRPLYTGTARCRWAKTVSLLDFWPKLSDLITHRAIWRWHC